MKASGAFGAALLLNPWMTAGASISIADYKKNVITLDEELTPEDDATSYNNFYEFGTGKDDPVRRATKFNTDDWKITVGGECEKPGTYSLEDLIKPFDIEERVYRLRCVEAWSMVIPWLGVPLASVIKSLQPTSKAKYVAFKTLLDPSQMPGQNRSVLQGPYRERLRIDEATNPLTLFAVGMYGKTMPNQNGAPVRLVVPWKYGFKSIKSIVSIDFVEQQPQTSWNMASDREYGFYSNVNPTVNHPRWSQKKERRIGDIFKRETLMFNGYEEEVAHMYDDMDLQVNY
jgi:sulfoxide reductase catalytic subunit YedY